MMKLYGVRTSPYVRHARVALAESGLSWQFEQVTPETIDMSPTLRVPFLVDGNLTLTDSAVIVRYAREQSGQAFLPSVGDHELFALATSVLDTAVNLYLLNIGDSTALAEVATGTSAIGFNPKSDSRLAFSTAEATDASHTETVNNRDSGADTLPT